MGSAPPGVPSDYYSSILRESCSKDSKVLLDSVFGLFEAMRECQSIGCRVVVKINTRELCKIMGVSVQGGSEAAAAVADELVQEASNKMREQLISCSF